MEPDQTLPARKKILFYLKTRGPQTATQLAERLNVTPMAVRQHLSALDEEGTVTYEIERRPVGRPAHRYQLTDAASVGFPDSHAALAVGLIGALRTVFGEEGLERLVAERARQQRLRYTRELPGGEAPLVERVAALARLRADEGYLAEVEEEPDGTLWLIENHCPVCAAATECAGLCAAEVKLFAELFSGATVERTEHSLSGARRCAYRITPSKNGGAVARA